jgi:hypothetical protein
MAIRTFRGTTNSLWTVATNWLEGAVPVIGDTVIHDASSPNCTLDTMQPLYTTWDMSAYTGLLTYAVSWYLRGNTTFGAGMTINHAAQSVYADTFGSYSLNANGKVIANNIIGGGQTLTLTGNIGCANGFNPSNVNIGSYTVSCNYANIVSICNVTTGKIYCGYDGLVVYAFSCASGNLGTAAISLLGASAKVITGTAIGGNFVFSGTTANQTVGNFACNNLTFASQAVTIGGSITCNDFTLPTASTATSTLSLPSSLTTRGTFTAVGTLTNRWMIKSSVLGTQRTINVTGTKNISFTNFQDIKGLANVALASAGSVATASEYSGSPAVYFSPNGAINGDRVIYNSSGYNWMTVANTLPARHPWWICTFPAARIIDTIDVISLRDNFTDSITPYTLSETGSLYLCTEFTVEYYDGAAWVLVEDVTGNVNPWRRFTFAAVSATQIRITVNAVGSSASGSVRMIEIEAHNTATWDLRTGVDTTETVGDCLGNSGITFPASLNLYSKDNLGGNQTWYKCDAGRGYYDWNNGTPGTSLLRAPLPQDNVFFNNSSFLGAWGTYIDVPYPCATFDASAVTNAAQSIKTPAAGIEYALFGYFKTGKLTSNGIQNARIGFYGRDKNSAGTTIPYHEINFQQVWGYSTAYGFNINSFGGTYTLTNDLTMASGVNNGITVTSGTFSTGGKNVTTSFLSSNNTNTRTIDISNSLFFIPQFSTQPNANVNLGSGLNLITTNSVLSCGIWSSASITLGGYTFDKIQFNMTANVLTTSSFSCNALTIFMGNPNGTLQQANNTTITILKEPKIKIVGVSGNFNIIGYLSPRAYISNKTGKPLLTAKIKLTNVTVIGPTLYAEKSVNGGNNSNVCFYPMDTRTLVKKYTTWFYVSSGGTRGRLLVGLFRGRQSCGY